MADQKEKNGLFREKSIERISTPERLDEYLRVTSPGVWLVLAAVVILLAGVCIWGIFGRIQETTPAAVITENGKSTCLVPASALENVISSRTVTVDGEEMTLVPSVPEAQIISETTDIYTILAGKLSVGDIVYPIPLEKALADDGVVSGVLVTESLSPASLFFDS